MKGLVIFIILIVTGIILVYPYVTKEKQCYQNAQKLTDDIGFKVIAKRLDLSEVCRQRADVLFDLENCVRVATSSGWLPKYANSVIQGAFYVVRPVSKGLGTLKSEHNAECTNYIKYQLE